MTKLDELKLDVGELHELLDKASRQKVKDLLLLEIRKIETEMIKLNEVAEKPIQSASGAQSSTDKCYDVKLSTYAWDQSEKFVKIFVTLKNVHTLAEDKIHCSFDSSSMELTIKELDRRNYTLNIKGLLHEINIPTSYWKVKNDIVVVFLAKKKQGQKWGHLSSTEQKSKEPKKPESSDDPGADLMNLMRKMYEEGDDEMKRNIAKAWTENRGQNLMA